MIIHSTEKFRDGSRLQHRGGHGGMSSYVLIEKNGTERAVRFGEIYGIRDARNRKVFKMPRHMREGRLGSITHDSDPVYKDGELIGRNLVTGGWYRYYESEIIGMINLMICLEKNSEHLLFGPFKNRTLAGNFASKKIREYWEEKYGRGIRPTRSS